MVVIAGPTASGKTSLALHLARTFHGEIVSCDSVAVYREMEIGTAKPTHDERSLVPHHMIDIAWPGHPCTAGDYSRLAREALAGISARSPDPNGRSPLPIVAGGTGLYLRALIEGLFPAPPQKPEQRGRLRQIAATRGSAYLHRMLARLDPAAAAAIHANDVPKAIRAIEVSLAATQHAPHGSDTTRQHVPNPSDSRHQDDTRSQADKPTQDDSAAPMRTRTPITVQWQKGRDALTGYRILRLGLNPPRARLYERINQRAADMFDRGLVEETERLISRYGPHCRPLTSLGYAEAAAVLRGELTREQAVARAQQGHRNYAKRQLTWFRREPAIHWLEGCGADPDIQAQASLLVQQHLNS
ncbi:MAG: tRNA (adenosine(37)-N6)-dimethylallyltransferase MiaA [Acidobacteriota bacterium]|nr:tRNA (adenosine(37)-N6)-dimethylallyltransferase MiaA [Acidobacteriota bacterium]